MSPDAAYELIKICLTEGFTVVTPIILIALVIGVLVSLVQSITTLQEQTLTFVPKLLVSGLALWFLAPWMLERLSGLLVLMIQRSGEVLR